MHPEVTLPQLFRAICRRVSHCRSPHWLIAAVLAALVAVEGHAQSRPDPLSVEDAVQTRHVACRTPIHLSPDGEWVAYTVRDCHRSRDALEVGKDLFTAMGVWSEAAGTQVYITHTQTGETLELTDSGANSWAPAWSPEGAYLAFYSDHVGQANLWVWERAGHGLRRVSTEVVRPAWTRHRELLTAGATVARSLSTRCVPGGPN